MDFSQRLLEAINELNPAARGTLWFVNDVAWEQVIPCFIRKRKGHPGLAVGCKKVYHSLNDTVPMMIGTSKNHGGLRIDDAMPHPSSQKRHTFFSYIRPLMPIGREDPLAVKNFIGQSDLIHKNHDKPRLTDEEMFRLEAYLYAKGVR